jgi:hypothetical protein
VIANLNHLTPPGSISIVGEVPRILVNMKDEAVVTVTRLKTQRLAEEYGGVIFQQE